MSLQNSERVGGVNHEPMSRERFEETIIALCNMSARRHGKTPLDQAEADGLYQQYIEGNGSFFSGDEA